MLPQFDVSSVDVTGTRVTTGAAGKTAIPVASNGAIPKFVRIDCATVNGFAYVRPTQNANGANTDPVVAYGMPIVFAARGYSHIGHLQGTTADVIIITPLENA